MSKGSKQRPTKKFVFDQNYDSIDWDNSRRNKIQKMHGVEIKEGQFPCQECGGNGSFQEGGQLSPFITCDVCKGTGKIPRAVFLKQLDIDDENIHDRN